MGFRNRQRSKRKHAEVEVSPEVVNKHATRSRGAKAGEGQAADPPAAHQPADPAPQKEKSKPERRGRKKAAVTAAAELGVREDKQKRTYRQSASPVHVFEVSPLEDCTREQQNDINEHYR